MFRRPPTGQRLIAFLLPLIFVWNWAACSLLCGEITARHEKHSPAFARDQAEHCFAGIDTDDCPYTATTAVTEARQNLDAPVEEAINIMSLPLPEFSFVSVSTYSADINQNSPPRSSSDPPLFLRHCAFRI